MGLGNTIVDIACLGAVPGLTYRFLRFIAFPPKLSMVIVTQAI